MSVRVRQWTGAETRALRDALRLSVRRFANQLGVAVRTVSKWEAGGRTIQLRPDTQSILDTALAHADEAVQNRFVWLLQTTDSADCQQPLSASTAIEPADLELLHVTRLGQLAAPVLGALSAKVDSVREQLDRTLVSQSVSGEQLDRLEETIASHAIDCVRRPPIDMLCRLTLGVAGVQPLLASAQTPETMHRLYRAVAGFSVLLADELMVLGDTYAANAWYGTARTAAEQTRDQALQAMVLTLAALLPLYWGSPQQAVALTRQASRVAQGTTGMANAMAPSVAALALAQIGDRESSDAALKNARQLFDRNGDPPPTDSVFCFSERRFRFYEGKTLSRLGRHKEADRVFDQALALYPSNMPGDPTLISLERAAGLVRAGDLQTGIDVAQRTLTKLPADSRADIFLRAGQQMLTAVPAIHRKTRAVRDYATLLRELTPLSVGKPSDR